LKSEYNWEIELIDYSVFRDIEERDIIDVEKVADEYIELIPEWYRNLKNYEWDNWIKQYWEVKNSGIKDEEIKIITIYFYWLNWNINQWINDYRFWWNFNRIQNLMIRNNWIYITTEFTNFNDKWVSDISYLIDKLNKKYINAEIIISWASSGWALIWNILEEERLKKIVKWVLLIGSTIDMDYKIDNLIPIYIWHWTKDRNIPYLTKYDFYNKLKEEKQNYPIKIEFFNWWIHWTPIRMINWLDAINWIFEQNHVNKN
jgi:hypothetical protein